MKAPFPWYGGKSTVSNIIWQRFGNVRNYVEPFYGSGAVHLLRPIEHKSTIWPLETINDYDGYIANFWRSIKHAPEDVAEWADEPVNENDLHARHIWLVEQQKTLRARLEGNIDFYDTRIAGYWVWGICCWIGGHFCSGGNGPWQSVEMDDGSRQLVHLGNVGMGINLKRVHLGDGENGIVAWFNALSDRLSRVRVASGDWSRVCTNAGTVIHGLTGVFLDPPYGEEAKRDDLYRIDSHTLAHDVRDWCHEWGDNPKMRIALCGYEGEHESLENVGWSVWSWKAQGGMSNRRKNGTNENRHRERIWFSPHCIGEMKSLPIFGNS